MEMKGMNPYQHFGLRQAWLEHYMAEGTDCFSQGVLGTRQYDGLKAWLKESNLLVANKDKTLSTTVLFDKLKAFGPYNPFTWAIIWANLAYNSVITRWYCLNAEPGAPTKKLTL